MFRNNHIYFILPPVVVVIGFEVEVDVVDDSVDSVVVIDVVVTEPIISFGDNG